jgi:hypothetical protein
VLTGGVGLVEHRGDCGLTSSRHDRARQCPGRWQTPVVEQARMPTVSRQ